MNGRKHAKAVPLGVIAVLASLGAATEAVGDPDLPVPDVPQVPALQPPSAPSLPEAPKVPHAQSPELPAAPRVPSVDTPAGVPGPGGTSPSSPSAPSAGAPASVPAAGTPGSDSGSGPSGAGSPASPVTASADPRRVVARRRARARRTARRLARTVRRLSSCFYAISPFQRRVLTLRAGLEGDALSRGAVARRLDASPAHVRSSERRGVRALRRANRSDGCGRASMGAYAEDGARTVVAATAGGQQLATVPTLARSAERASSESGGVLGKQSSGGDRPRGKKGGALGIALSEPSSASRTIVGVVLALMLLTTLLVLLVRRERHRPHRAYESYRESYQADSGWEWPAKGPDEDTSRTAAPRDEGSRSTGFLRAVGLAGSGIVSLVLGRLLGRRMRGRR